MDLTDFHSFFIEPFEIHSESFPTWRVVNNLTYVYKTYIFMHAIVSERVFPQSGLSSPLLNLSQSIMDIHPNFYDPLEMQMERTFQENMIVNILAITVHSAFKFIFLTLIIFILLLLMFGMYIHAGIKMREWLHWKYDYT